MSGVQRLGLLLASIAVAAAVVSVAIVVTRPPSRTISIDELRAGVDFVLGGVRIQETGFQDNQNGPVVDGGYIASFRVTFPDSVFEDLDFQFDGYCPVGAASEGSTPHHGPTAVFKHWCGDAFVRVTVT